MGKAQKWVFWQTVPSPHLAPFFRELSLRLGSDASVICVFEKSLPKERLALGWQQPDFGEVQVLRAPSDKEIDTLLEAGQMQACHFFSGLISSKRLRAIYQRVPKERAFLGIITEDRDGNGFLGGLRRVHSRWLERMWRGRLDVAFAMGTRGTEWLESVGYNPAIVYPFGYVVDPSGAPERRVELSDEVRYVFVGRLDRGKNSALLLEAFLRTDFRECQLIIVGDGPERARLEKKVGKSEFGRNVSFRGILPNTEVRRILDCADCLVLPSRYDGWGAVVNEALLAGARAVVSDGCGAADVIDEGKNGFVFQSGDVESLVSAMTQIRDEGPLDPASKEELRRSAAVIGPEAVVEYFLDVVKFLQSGKEGIRPKPPWEKHRSGKEARVGDGTGVLQCQGIR